MGYLLHGSDGLPWPLTLLMKQFQAELRWGVPGRLPPPRPASLALSSDFPFPGSELSCWSPGRAARVQVSSQGSSNHAVACFPVSGSARADLTPGRPSPPSVPSVQCLHPSPGFPLPRQQLLPRSHWGSDRTRPVCRTNVRLQLSPVTRGYPDGPL